MLTYGQVLERLKGVCGAVQACHPLTPADMTKAFIGPVISKAQYDKVNQYIAGAQKEGASLFTGTLSLSLARSLSVSLSLSHSLCLTLSLSHSLSLSLYIYTHTQTHIHTHTHTHTHTHFTGGKRPENAPAKGFYIAPTVLTNVEPHMTIWKEEVLPFFPFSSFLFFYITPPC
jgi:acyl-CoA reductase-like NAD-dependent aldehyde dehydrogenase